MTIKEIQAKSILIKHKKIDSWFVSRYGMNLYRGCIHNCLYCDGRSDKYGVEGEFGKDISVKINAIEILNKELNPERKRQPMKKGFIMIGGGVGDGYQPAEKKYQLTKKVLQLIDYYKFPIHILTKSCLVKRDIDLIDKINKRKKAIVSFSFSSTDDKISSIFEPGVSLPSERLETIKKFKERGISCGMFLMPVIPFITDSYDIMKKTVKDSKDAGIDFIIFSGMTLKKGKQKDYFYSKLKKFHPKLINDYEKIYKDDIWGSASNSYYDKIHKDFFKIISEEKIPIRIPSSLFENFVDLNDLIVVILEHIDYLLKMQGGSSSYKYAAYSISQLKEPISIFKDNLQQFKGIGKQTEKIISEIIDSGKSSLYKKLTNYWSGKI